MLLTQSSRLQAMDGEGSVMRGGKDWPRLITYTGVSLPCRTIGKLNCYGVYCSPESNQANGIKDRTDARSLHPGFYASTYGGYDRVETRGKVKETRVMKPYRLHEADLQIPDGWSDNTIHAFSTGDGHQTSAANFVITRDSVTQCDDVQAYADQQLVEAAKKLKGYKLLGRKLVSLSGLPAMETNYTWLTPERIQIQQRQAYVKRGAQFLIFTLTSKSESFKSHDSTWTAIMESIRLR